MLAQLSASANSTDTRKVDNECQRRITERAVHDFRGMKRPSRLSVLRWMINLYRYQ